MKKYLFIKNDYYPCNMYAIVVVNEIVKEFTKFFVPEVFCHNYFLTRLKVQM